MAFTNHHYDLADETLGGAEVAFQDEYDNLVRRTAQAIADAEVRGHSRPTCSCGASLEPDYTNGDHDRECPARRRS